MGDSTLLVIDYRSNPFIKPLNLPPDRCSKLVYVENREVLKPFSAGTGEPENLSEYERFLESAQHG